MIGHAPSTREKDGRLWAIAFALSLVLNVTLLGLAGFASIKTSSLAKPRPALLATPAERFITILPDVPATEPDAPGALPPPVKPRFARTSADQTSTPPASAAFIGERDTTATSDRTSDATAPPLPSQSGEKPLSEDDFETTQSNYRDGKIVDSSPPNSSAPSPPSPPMPVAPPAPDATGLTELGETRKNPGKDSISSSPPPSETLLQGNNPVDIPVPLKTTEDRDLKPTPPKQAAAGNPTPKAAELPKPPASKPVDDPAFAGHQRKAAIVGSISRTGRSALNVADSPLGRYQAVISRAVELEWQRNCVRHRDFITPGYLTVRFFVETNGKVRTVQFVGKMETGEVQKGFTLNSIRDAEIPAMPAAVKKEFEKQPLELIFNFYF